MREGRPVLAGVGVNGLKVEHEPDLDKSSGDEDAHKDHKVFSRVRRSLNPDRTPKVNTVSTDVVV